MNTFVQQLHASANTRFQRGWPQPDIVFVDRGGSFYAGDGKITYEFAVSLRENNFSSFHGNDGSVQPGRSGELWLHETVVPWVHDRLNNSLAKELLHEDEEHFAKRLKATTDLANAHFDVKSLRREMPARMHQLVKVKHGDRLAT